MSENAIIQLLSPCYDCVHVGVCRHMDAYEAFVKESDKKLQEIVTDYPVIAQVVGTRKNKIIWDFCVFRHRS